MANKNDRLVAACFNNKAAAERAVDGIKSWDKADDDVKLDAIAVMTLDNKGQLHADEIGQGYVVVIPGAKGEQQHAWT